MKFAWVISGMGRLAQAASKFDEVSLIVLSPTASRVDLVGWAKTSARIPCELIDSDTDYSGEIESALDKHKIDYAFFTYNRILRGPILETYHRRMINFHPAPLPEYPGLNGYHDAYDHGVLGVTYHWLETETDCGEVLSSVRYPVRGISLSTYGAVIYSEALGLLMKLIPWLRGYSWTSNNCTGQLSRPANDIQA
jgi:phosphoribosylglycinamide formyltransferase-1